MNIRSFSKHQLEVELERRKWNMDNKPTILDHIDVSDLEICCQKYIDHIAENCMQLVNGRQLIFEAAMKACFDDDIFDWIDEKME